MTAGAYRARKGDICAVAKRYSSTMNATGEHWEWHVGRVASATREGVIKTAICYDRDGEGGGWEGLEREYDRNRCWKALEISTPEYRAAAEKLIGRVFPSDESLRVNILAMAAEGERR